MNKRRLNGFNSEKHKSLLRTKKSLVEPKSD
jgi:hypothetical protein